MRYHYQMPDNYSITKAKVYHCDHPLYSKCTLYEFGNKGLAVVQKRFDADLKVSWWDSIDPWLVDDIFEQEGFLSFFDRHAEVCTDGLYPTISVRKLMWAVKMKPLPKHAWEKDL